jgi:hypothetical protein
MEGDTEEIVRRLLPRDVLKAQGLWQQSDMYGNLS